MLVNFFILLSTLFLVSGLALDVGMLQLRKLQIQHAADAAALGATCERARGYSDWVAAGKADAALNGFTNGVNGVAISIVSPPTGSAATSNPNGIQVTISQTYHTAFMGLVSGSATSTPGASSIANAQPVPDCVYIMNSQNQPFPFENVTYSGFYSSCNIYVNNDGFSIYNDSGSTLSASGYAIKSTSSSTAGSLLEGPVNPTPSWNSLVEIDPLAWETAPTFSSCTYTSKTVTNSSATLNPGTYCGGITLNNATVTFNPGLYIVTGGMTWENGSTITGTGVTFYLTTGGGFGYANFNIENSTVTLSAPTSTSGGGLTGIVFFGDRNWSAQMAQDVQVLSSYVVTDGIWYFLNTGIYNYTSTIKGTNYIGIITDNILTKYATFTIPSPNYASLSGGSPYQGNNTPVLAQ